MRHYRNGLSIQDKLQVKYNTSTEGLAVIGVDLVQKHFVKMQVASIAVFNRALSDTERFNVENYFTLKYGVGPKA